MFNKKLMVMLLALLVIVTGCSNGNKDKEELKPTATCEVKNGQSSFNYVLYADGDTLKKEIVTNKLHVKELGLTESYMQSQYDIFDEKYDINGVEYKTRFENGFGIEEITIDFTTATISDLMEIGLVEKTSKPITYISLDITMSSVKAIGGTCSTVE